MEPLPSASSDEAVITNLVSTGRYYEPTIKALSSVWLRRLYDVWQRADKRALVMAERLPGECQDGYGASIYCIEFDCGAEYIGQTTVEVIQRLDEHLGRFSDEPKHPTSQRPKIKDELRTCAPTAYVLESGLLGKSEVDAMEQEYISILCKPLNEEHTTVDYIPCSRRR